MSHRAVLATRNVDDFVGLDIEIVNPFRCCIRSARRDRDALRLIFMGTPDFAVPTLVEIVGRGHEVVAVYTRAPKPAGRGMELQVTPVEREARRFGIPVLTPKTLRSDDAVAAFRAHGRMPPWWWPTG